MRSEKKSFLVLLYSAKSISDHVTISWFFSSFFQKIYFFLLFQPLYFTGEKHEVRKKSIFVLFYGAKSNLDHFTISNFSSFFQKINFFYFFDPLYCTGEKSEVSKKSIFSALL